MRALVLAAALGLAFAASASAQTDYERQVRGYLEHGMSTHAALGYARDESNADLVVPLELERPYLWSVYLREGVSYRVYGACDIDCRDLDMEIYGADGHLMDRDVARDDVPYVQITPAETGRHYVRIWLFDCSAEPCYVAGRVMSGGTPAPRDAAAAEEDAADVGGAYERVVEAELAAGGARFESAGYTPWGADIITPIMLAGDGHRQSYDLQVGRSYVFQGACDQDCTDVDIEVLDAAGQRVAVDEASDDLPAVALTPTQAGPYTVRIWLAQCSVEPCFVGVRAYQR